MAAAVMAVHALKKRKEDMEYDILSVFHRYDADGSGEIDKGELLPGLKDLGVEGLTMEHIDKIFKLLVQRKRLDAEAIALDLWSFEYLVTTIRGVLEDPKRDTSAWFVVEEKVPFQTRVNKIYESTVFTWSVASLIIGNFVVNMIESEIDPGVTVDGSLMKNLKPLWDGFDVFFNIIFLIELLVNMYRYGGPRREFWLVPWNVFDSIIVLIGVLLLTPFKEISPQMAKLKLLRAFRVFRLFKRVESLNNIVTSLVRALPGMLNSLLIMVIVFCVYAVLAVDLFHEHGVASIERGEEPHTGTMVTYLGDGENITMAAQTSRGVDFGWEYYGTFARSLYTLFQVMTGDSWSEAVARPLLFGYATNGVTVALFYVSFVIVTNIVLVNIVVAALLEKFVAIAANKISANVLLDHLEDAERGGIRPPDDANSTAPIPTHDKSGITAALTATITTTQSATDAKLSELMTLVREQQNSLAAMQVKLDKALIQA